MLWDGVGHWGTTISLDLNYFTVKATPTNHVSPFWNEIPLSSWYGNIDTTTIYIQTGLCDSQCCGMMFGLTTGRFVWTWLILPWKQRQQNMFHDCETRFYFLPSMEASTQRQYTYKTDFWVGNGIGWCWAIRQADSFWLALFYHQSNPNTICFAIVKRNFTFSLWSRYRHSGNAYILPSFW